MTTERAPARKSCIWHCCTCHRHFSSLSAFDGHRKENECVDPEEIVFGANSKRAGDNILTPWTTEGSCTLMPGSYKDGRLVKRTEGVTVWQIATTLEQREALMKLGQSVLF